MVRSHIIKEPDGTIEVHIFVPWVDIKPQWNQFQQNQLAELKEGLKTILTYQIDKAFEEGFLKMVMPDFLITILKEEDIVPIDRPKYILVLFKEGQELQFMVTFIAAPKVTVGEYRKINIAKPVARSISEEEVNQALEDMYRHWLASSSQVPNTQEGSLELESNFIKAMEVRTPVELQEKIKSTLEDSALYETELEFEKAILNEVERLTNVKLPKTLIDDEVNRMLATLERQITDRGFAFDEYLATQNTTLGQLKAEWRPRAQKNVRTELGLAEIAKLENVDVSENEIKTRLNSLQKSNEGQLSNKNANLYMKHAIRQTKTLELLKKLVLENS